MTDDISLKPMVSILGIAVVWSVFSAALSKTITVPATLYEHNNVGDAYTQDIWGVRYVAQTFTPLIAHTITSVKLKLYRVDNPGIVTVSIKATDASGHPTGVDLCSGTTDGNTLPTGSPYEWREITLGDGHELSASVKYAIVVRALDAIIPDALYWRLNYPDLYANGNFDLSEDQGGSWDPAINQDCMFEEWQSAHTIIHSPLFG